MCACTFLLLNFLVGVLLSRGDQGAPSAGGGAQPSEGMVDAADIQLKICIYINESTLKVLHNAYRLSNARTQQHSTHNLI